MLRVRYGIGRKWEPRFETVIMGDKRAEITDSRYNL